ncbi:unnamed protein product, partial [Polarella glacialis]
MPPTPGRLFALSASWLLVALAPGGPSSTAPLLLAAAVPEVEQQPQQEALERGRSELHEPQEDEAFSGAGPNGGGGGASSRPRPAELHLVTFMNRFHRHFAYLQVSSEAHGLGPQ